MSSKLTLFVYTNDSANVVECQPTDSFADTLKNSLSISLNSSSLVSIKQALTGVFFPEVPVSHPVGLYVQNIADLRILSSEVPKPIPRKPVVPEPVYPPESEVQPYLNDAQHFFDENNFLDALPLLQKAVEIRPIYVPAHNLLGQIYQRSKNFNDAVTHFKLAYTHSKDPSYLINVADCYEKSNLIDKAIEHYSDAEIKSKDTPSLSLTGRAGVARCLPS
ncbi:hypothetical protein GEMRC1_003605 [Eukaryota sp. GEM-RC1]